MIREPYLPQRGARITITEWRDRCAGARHGEKATRNWEQSIWSQHVEPAWGSVRLESILRPDVNAWVNDVTKADVGPHTVIGAINVLSGLLEQAVDARVIRIERRARR